MYKHELTDKAFDKLVPVDRYYSTCAERQFMRELWETYILHRLPHNYHHEEDIEWNRKSMKSAKCLLEGHMYVSEIWDFQNIHKMSKTEDINKVLERFLDDV